jgi:hypothetical protein
VLDGDDAGADFELECAEGRRMALDDAVAYALAPLD